MKLSDLNSSEVTPVSSASPPQPPLTTPDNSTSLQDFGLGAASGATLGTAPILAGGALAAKDKLQDFLSGNQGAEFLESYRKHQQDVQALMNAAHARSPKTFMAGQLAGGVGLGAATAGTGLLGEAGSLSEAAGQGLGPLTAELGARAAEGAGIGSLAGAAESEGNLDTEEGRQQMLSDAASGAKLGGIAGPVLGTAIEGVAGLAGMTADQLAKAAEDNPNLKRFLMSFSEGIKSKGFKGLAAEQESTNNINASAQDLANDLYGARTGLSKEVGSTLEDSEDISPSEFISDAQKEVVNLPEENQDLDLANTRDYSRLSGLLNRFKSAVTEDANTDLVESPDILDSANRPMMVKAPEEAPEVSDVSPQELFNLRKDLADLQTSSTEPAVKEQISNLVGKIDTQLQQNPEYQQALKNLQTIPAQTAELFTGRPLNAYSTQAEAQGALQQGLAQNIRQIGGYGAKDSDIQARDTFQQLKQNLMNFEQAQPDLFQALGLTGIHDKLKNAATVSDLEEIRQIINRKVPHGSILENIFDTALLPIKLLGLGGGSNLGTALNLTNRVGYAAGKIGMLSKGLYNAPDAALLPAADVLKSGGLTYLGEALERAINSKDQVLKNTALFSIMQNPQARGLLHLSDKDQQ
jgi:hypothetical protein